MSGLVLCPALSLVEAVHGFGAGGRRTCSVFSARGSEGAEHQGGKGESESAAHTQPYAPPTELGLNGHFAADWA